MGKRGLILLVAIAGALALALVFLLREAREDDGEPKTAEARDRRASRSSSGAERSSGKAALRRQTRTPGKPPPEGGRGPVIKTTKDGRTYVESIQPDGRRIRDFRKSAVRDAKREKRLSGGPRLLGKRNATNLQRDLRSRVWKCVQDRYDRIMALPGIGKIPAVLIYAGTRADAAGVEITTVEVELEADQQDPDLARCIEGAVQGHQVGLAAGEEQKPYEDFELGMRYKVPPPKR